LRYIYGTWVQSHYLLASKNMDDLKVENLSQAMDSGNVKIVNSRTGLPLYTCSNNTNFVFSNTLSYISVDKIKEKFNAKDGDRIYYVLMAGGKKYNDETQTYDTDGAWLETAIKYIDL